MTGTETAGGNTPEESGWNWRSTLGDFATISGVLAGFSVTFIALLLAKPVSDVGVLGSSITFGQLSVLLFGVSTALFIAAAEYFLEAKEFDIYSVPDRYLHLFEEEDADKEKWKKRQDLQTTSLRRREKRGRVFYDIAIFAVFIGLWFAIAPYSIVIAFIVAGVGIGLEISQYVS